jgi:hypothetical protein
MGVSQTKPFFQFSQEKSLTIPNQGFIYKPLMKTLRQEEEELQNYFFYTEIFKDCFKK